ncbi:YrhK family protein [Leifsonia sp. F6_8S_P_1B]|uniref:YrhK family protein n=1 Tax=Leifsonia williamsii TaxID=3035919 RepID=A0ABT8K942_9MICO|nr:YrhK family protein [Leifsonia williamsii]MDN4613968.1 YrhK family protein [Leifsonia williamsii]
MARGRSVRARVEPAAFALGSACFAVAAIPVLADAIGAIATNAIFFAGSVLFTTGAALEQTRVGWSPRRSEPLDWWASAVQLLGTLFFNVSTAVALAAAVPAGAQGGTGWRPDVFGSACFLLSSALAVRAARLPEGRSREARSPDERREAALNFAGSVLFGISAVGAFIRPATGQELSASWTDLGTFGGALLFLAAAGMSGGWTAGRGADRLRDRPSSR